MYKLKSLKNEHSAVFWSLIIHRFLRVPETSA